MVEELKQIIRAELEFFNHVIGFFDGTDDLQERVNQDYSQMNVEALEEYRGLVISALTDFFKTHLGEISRHNKALNDSAISCYDRLCPSNLVGDSRLLSLFTDSAKYTEFNEHYTGLTRQVDFHNGLSIDQVRKHYQFFLRDLRYYRTVVFCPDAFFKHVTKFYKLLCDRSSHRIPSLRAYKDFLMKQNQLFELLTACDFEGQVDEYLAFSRFLMQAMIEPSSFRRQGLPPIFATKRIVLKNEYDIETMINLFGLLDDSVSELADYDAVSTALQNSPRSQHFEDKKDDLIETAVCYDIDAADWLSCLSLSVHPDILIHFSQEQFPGDDSKTIIKGIQLLMVILGGVSQSAFWQERKARQLYFEKERRPLLPDEQTIFDGRFGLALLG